MAGYIFSFVFVAALFGCIQCDTFTKFRSAGSQIIDFSAIEISSSDICSGSVVISKNITAMGTFEDAVAGPTSKTYTPTTICEQLKYQNGPTGDIFKKIAATAGTGCPIRSGKYDVSGAKFDVSSFKRGDGDVFEYSLILTNGTKVQEVALTIETN